MDESELNEYTLKVVLPVDDSSPPSTSFKVNFNCNGVKYISEEFDNVDDALAWAQDTLVLFGDWSLDGNTLILENSLCGVGSLSTTA